MNKPESDNIFFHINRTVPWYEMNKWNIGDVIETSDNHNPFFRFFKTHSKTYALTTPDNTVVQIPGKQFLVDVRDGKINCPNVAQVAVDLTAHFVNYVRELIWEDIRKNEFPHLPSRQRCLWLINDKQGVKYWLDRFGLDINDFQITKVKVDGKLHISSDEHLLIDSEPMDTTILKARAYWNGQISNPTSVEVLFEGKLQVIEIIDPIKFLYV
ncbi:DUF2441 domain-containing protein [Vibrio plantisponsor]|uniref:DUF2441 domain-containing protein n=1 Tax=Vibrio plantisponsor TaxID=664643 RepID=UPI00370A4C04